MLEKQTQDMTSDEARDITECIKSSATKLWELLYEAHERKAHKALGYTSWATYLKEEFDISTTHSYQLLGQAKVMQGIGEATGLTSQVSAMADISERQARRLKPYLAEVTNHIKDEISNGAEPHEAVSSALQKYDVLPTPAEARSLAHETGVAVIGSDAIYHDGRTPDEIEETKDDTARRFRLYDALETLATMGLSPEDTTSDVPHYQRFRIDGHLEDAVEWLNSFVEEWRGVARHEEETERVHR